MYLLLDGEQSKRLTFRKITPSDFNSWLPFHEEPLSTQYWEGEKKIPLEACKNQFKAIFERYNNKLGGMNALINSNTNAFIGICGLLVQKVDCIPEIEIGYSVLPKYWKQGYATEAAKKCKNFAIANKISESIISIIHIDNIPSQKVAIANGMFLDKTTTYKNNPVHIYRIKL
ncbi:GNAT family N-acetyltransferase [Maribacter sp.]|uniref:GNAT family N-acetyltransferase n=1 Tax=Maribacter sp. TaxID=1897614 RepID=UPI0025C29853|nr:GNAT family N-acetyltransferase [Maribacter sp.]